MYLTLSHMLLSTLFAILGLGIGWWLRSRIRIDGLTMVPTEIGAARELISGLHLVSARLAADVGQHHNKVSEVDRQLESHGRDAEIDHLVDRLLKANQQVQAKLSDTEQRLDKLSEEIEHHATEARTDALTGLTNRRAFEEVATDRLERFQQSEQTFSLLMLDIDHFKQVNDTHGHQAGDDILRGVGRVLRETLRGRDVVSRYGGEEFTVLLPTTSIDNARNCAEGVRQAIAEAEFQAEDLSLNVTVSVGVAEILPYEKMASLIKRADQSMYAAKHAGRNRSYWHDGTLVHPVRFPAIAHDQQDDLRLSPQADRWQTDADQQRHGPSVPFRASPADSIVRLENHEPEHREQEYQEYLGNMANKTMFCQELRRRLAESNRDGFPFTAALAQVDDHQRLVDAYGEATVKEILTTVARELNCGVREMDLIARFDSSTFGIVFPKATLQNAICLGERLRKAIHNLHLIIEGQSIDVSISLGLVEFLEHEDMASMVERAQSQLELAIQSGGNRSSFTSSATTVG